MYACGSKTVEGVRRCRVLELEAKVNALAEAGLIEPPDGAASPEDSVVMPPRCASDDEASDPAHDPSTTPAHMRKFFPTATPDEHDAL